MRAIFSSFTSRKSFRERAQAIAEFAIVLPILMAILVGILEAGRMVFIYAAVNNASREAARYASAVGLNNAGTTPKYKDCAGIDRAAKNSAFLVSVTTTITYDSGPATSSAGDCSSNPTVTSGMRANVTVSATYRPMVRLLPLPTRAITSSSSRTILGVLQLSYP